MTDEFKLVGSAVGQVAAEAHSAETKDVSDTDEGSRCSSPLDAAMDGSTMVSSTAIGGWACLTIIPAGGAGGDMALPGTYESFPRAPYREVGMTGSLVVHPPGTAVPGLLPLPSEDDA